jgi:hypothetical protein
MKGIAVQAMLRQMAIINAAQYCGHALVLWGVCDAVRGPPSCPPGGTPLLSSDILILLQMDEF